MANRAKAPSAKARKGKVKGKAIATLPKGAKGKKGKAAKPGIGHNSGVRAAITDEMIKSHEKALRAGLKNIAIATKEVNQERGVYRAARKLAKKEGYNLAAFDINWALEQEDLGKVQQNYADAARYQKVTDSALAQLSMFDSLLEPAPLVDVALQGLNAGKNAEPIENCPYAPGTENFVKWRDNWETGQQQNRQGLAG